ncbi:APC family permease [Anaerovorax odorimutans]|uniref:APC family permease n=1 Tax=Anaerovorax odorimutans TaxID=109327 RepID=UPI00040692A3|nr:APC family permease [Anaerovorax odorimutans]
MSKKNNVTLIGAIGIGIGGMVGGGIFAVLGLSISLSKGGAPLAFAIAGFIALITSYSYAKLSVAYPSSGGTVTFMNKGFGRGIFSGGTNNLLWVSYIIMLSLYASAFGTYAYTLYSITGKHTLDQHIYASAIIILATIINYYNVKIVSKVETLAVSIKMIILLIFVAAGVYGLFFSNNLNQLSTENWPDFWHLCIGGMVIFVAYEGMELIANVSPNIVNPKKNIMRAYIISTAIVVILYVVIVIVTVGSLTFSNIKNAQDYVLAEAAKPVLGLIGFKVIAIAALISTFSAINATIYGGSKVNYQIAEDDELPHEFTKIFLNQPIGLFVTSILTLIITNTLDLSSISTSGSAGFLLIFMLVNTVAYLKRKEINNVTFLSVIGIIFCGIAFLGLLFQQWYANRIGAIFAISMIAVSYICEFIFKLKEKNKNITN